MKIYTRTGDAGDTGLFGGPRVSKADPRIEAYGTVDELNAVVGIARTHLEDDLQDILGEMLEELQGILFVLGADLATPPGTKAIVSRVQQETVDRVEEWIDRLEEDLPELTNFILPGGCAAGAHLHLARTVCRRAEREMVRMPRESAAEEITIPLVNRVSDFLFVAARWANRQYNAPEQIWSGS